MFIALLEDDQDQSVLIQAWLEAANHKCKVFTSGKDLTMALVNESYDLLILDWMVPDMDGMEVLAWVRENIEWKVPVLFVTQRDAEEDVVSALTVGADDYMAKPIKRAEMLARIESISRRSQGFNATEEDQLAYPPYTLQRSARIIKLKDEVIEVTQKEFELTLFLFKNAGRVLSRGYILETVWGRSAEVNTRTVDTHVSRLRRKLSLYKENGWQLSSIYQHGYRLEKTESD